MLPLIDQDDTLQGEKEAGMRPELSLSLPYVSQLMQLGQSEARIILTDQSEARKLGTMRELRRKGKYMGCKLGGVRIIFKSRILAS